MRGWIGIGLKKTGGLRGEKNMGKILLYERERRYRIVSKKDLWDIYVPNLYEKLGIDIIR